MKNIISYTLAAVMLSALIAPAAQAYVTVDTLYGPAVLATPDDVNSDLNRVAMDRAMLAQDRFLTRNGLVPLSVGRMNIRDDKVMLHLDRAKYRYDVTHLAPYAEGGLWFHSF